METKRCPHCGETLPKSSTFCPACFKELIIETAEPVVVSKKRPLLFLWLGLLVLVILFFIFFCVFSQGQETNGNPTTFTPSPLSEGTASVDTAVPELTLGTNMPFDTNVPSVANTQTQFIESVTDTPIATTNGPTTETPSFSFHTPTFFPFFTSSATIGTPATSTSNVTNHRNTAATTSTPTKPVTTTGSKTPTQTRATATNKTTTTVKPTATAKPAATPTPVIDESLFVYTVSDGKVTITDYYGADAVLYVPSTLGGYPVTAIGDTAFNLATIKEAYIPNGVTYIGKSAFSLCHYLEKVYIPDSVTEIDQYAFSDCLKLSEIRLSKNLIGIYNYAFSNCQSLESIDLPNKLCIISTGVFDGTGIKYLKIPASVYDMNFACINTKFLEYIEVDAANSDYYSLDGVLFRNMHDGLYNMLIKYPEQKKSAHYTLPSNTMEIFTWAFRGNSFLKDVTLSPALIDISFGAFADCTSLTSVTTQENLMRIYDNTFSNCSKLTHINLGSNVSLLDKDTFSGCDNLTLTVVEGSYAHTFAKENNIPYKFKD